MKKGIKERIRFFGSLVARGGDMIEKQESNEKRS